MKRIIILLVASVVFLLAAAELNYISAINDAKASEGSDGAIYQAMSNKGFRTDIFEPITTADKVKALFN